MKPLADIAVTCPVRSESRRTGDGEGATAQSEAHWQAALAAAEASIADLKVCIWYKQARAVPLWLSSYQWSPVRLIQLSTYISSPQHRKGAARSPSRRPLMDLSSILLSSRRSSRLSLASGATQSSRGGGRGSAGGARCAAG